MLIPPPLVGHLCRLALTKRLVLVTGVCGIRKLPYSTICREQLDECLFTRSRRPPVEIFLGNCFGLNGIVHVKINTKECSAFIIIKRL